VARLRLLRIAQRAPRNFLGKQIARWARGLYLLGAPLPADLCVDDMRLRCYLRDNTGERKFAFTPWRFDPRERALLAEVLPPDGVFVDIGANVGIYTLSAALRLGALGRIVAFEPYPPAFQRLLFNIAATRAGHDDWPHIETLQLGIADREAGFELRIDAGNLGGGSTAPGNARFSKEGSTAATTIRCRLLHDVLTELHVDRVDVMKIDVEGSEDVALCPFLERADDALLPRHLIVEQSAHLWSRDLPGMLAARGYRRRFATRLNSAWSR
jgi:FkbM family methyltransferase